MATTANSNTAPITPRSGRPTSRRPFFSIRFGRSRIPAAGISAISRFASGAAMSSESYLYLPSSLAAARLVPRFAMNSAATIPNVLRATVSAVIRPSFFRMAGSIPSVKSRFASSRFERALDAVAAAFQSPRLAAVGSDAKDRTAAIRELAGLRAGLSILDIEAGELRATPCHSHRRKPLICINLNDPVRCYGRGDGAQGRN
jgi:hypothetical protein